jgi:acyl carrier protein phosphodiesterase
MNKNDLQQRIIQGHRKVDQLCQIADKLPRGPKRDELGDKSVRLLQNLHALEDGFIELYPDICLFIDKKCKDANKGCFPCENCSTYLNTLNSKTLI